MHRVDDGFIYLTVGLHMKCHHAGGPVSSSQLDPAFKRHNYTQLKIKWSGFSGRGFQILANMITVDLFEASFMSDQVAGEC